MILEFQVENYLSFKEKAKLSMLASPSKKELPDSVISSGKYNILSSVAIYGANASGKSNFLKAIRFMKEFIFTSARESHLGDRIKVKNFKLNTACDGQPSTFELTFIVKDTMYQNESKDVVFRYGFQISEKRVHAEWLFGRFTAQESKLFIRSGNNIEIGIKFIEGKRVYKGIGKIRETSLFLSQIASIKGENAPITHSIMNWFTKMQDISPMSDNNITHITADLMADQSKKERILKAFCNADICVEDIVVKKELIDLDDIPSEIRERIKKDLDQKELKGIHTFTIDAIHKKYNENKEEIGKVSFDFENEESNGSQKFFALIGPIIDSLQYGLVLIIDEIDARLHPNLCEMLISLFNSKHLNKNNAQLIFATHNTLIMNKTMLRRDQIYFVEKNKYGESEIYSLLDYKKVRNDASYDKDYLIGKYGGLPFLGNFESFMSEIE